MRNIEKYMVVPTYYNDFQCIAGACRHNCCIGWEIDIDRETLARYDAIPGEAGERLRRQIAGDPPHFILDSEERCPCLTGDNLCSLILTQGEGALCQICRDHPRFRNFWPGRTEEGLGACCEVAARLILSQKSPLTLVPDDSAITDGEARGLYALRASLLAAVYAQPQTLECAEKEALRLAGAALPEKSDCEWAAYYLQLERLDPHWTEVLCRVRDGAMEMNKEAFHRHMSARWDEYRHMLAYFLYRHVPEAFEDGDIVAKVSFAVLSSRFLRTVGAMLYTQNGMFSFEDQVELFRMYSAEIEYSEDNLESLYDELSGAYNGYL